MKLISFRYYQLLIFPLLSLVGFGQQKTGADSTKVLFGINDLKHIPASEERLLIGEFTISDGIGGYSYIFDDTGRFRRFEFSCVGRHYSDSGSYVIKKDGLLELTSKSITTPFILYKFDKYAFILPAYRVQRFKEEFVKYAEMIYRAKKITSNDYRYTDEFFIAFGLVRKYLTKLE